MTEVFGPLPPVRYRPLAVTIIGWYYFVAGVFGLLFSFIPVSQLQFYELWESMGISATNLRALGAGSGLVSAFSGWAVLRRQSWGRPLLFLYIPLTAAIGSWLMSGAYLALSIAGGVLTLAVVAFLLSRPAANGYFDGSVVDEPEDHAALRAYRRSKGSGSDLGRIFGVIAAAFAAIPLTMFAAVLGSARAMPAGGNGILIGTGLITLGIAGAIALAGVFLWGYRRVMAYLGWLFLACGAAIAFSGIALLMPLDPTISDSVLSGSGISAEEMALMMRSMAGSMLTWGVVLTVVGVPLLWYQQRKDEAAVAAPS